MGIKNKKKFFFRILLIACINILWINGKYIFVHASEGDTEKDFYIEQFFQEEDYKEVENILEENLSNTSFSFHEYVKKIVMGEESISFEGIGEQMKNIVTQEVSNNKKLWLQCFSIAIAISFFGKISFLFRSGQVSDTGFYIGYLILCVLLIQMYLEIHQIAETSLSVLITFMNALIPVYLLSVAVSNGADAASGLYPATFVIIDGMELILGKILLPMVEIYFLLNLINYCGKENRFSQICDCIKNGVKWCAKGILGVACGLQTLQGLIVPAVQEVKNNVILQTGGAIPVVGDTISGVTETLLSVTKLLKNGIGVTGIIAMILLCIAPFMKLLLFCVIYKIGGAFLQPLEEKRICCCFQGVGNAAFLLLYIVGIAFLLFCFTIIILTSVTR